MTAAKLAALAAFGTILAGCATPAPPPPPAPAVPPTVVVMPPPAAPPPVTVVRPPAPVVVAPRDPFGTILPGVVDLPRSSETGAIDGCTKVHKGLTIAGGFMFFTCEKLLPGVAVSRQVEIAREYEQSLELRGWTKSWNAQKKQNEFVQHDGFGCKMTVSIRPWTDRSMNEGRHRKGDREAFRQIVFQTNFAKGDACEPTYQAFRRGTLLR